MTRLEQQTDYDFIIVGARVAGAATAMLLARAGARVLVIDRSALGSDTLSTSFLMRGAVYQLHRWGILPELIAAGTPPVRATYFHYPSRTVKVDIRPDQGIDALYAPRRTLLDPLIVGAAQAAGAEIRFGVRALGVLRRSDGRVCGIELAEGPGPRSRVTAHTVIGADGLPSSVASWVEAVTYRRGKNAEPCIYGYFEGMTLPNGYHWHYGHGLAAGAAATNDGLTTVFAGAPAERLPELNGERAAGMLRIASELSPIFGEQVRAARRVGPLRVFPGVRGYYRRPWGPGWALVGDAGYFRDPNTAHGITDALRDAELLSAALLQGNELALADYHATRDAATERLFHASDELASGRWDEQRADELLREASAGMRDGMRALEQRLDGARLRDRQSYSPATILRPAHIRS